jgi:hypothetical protein
VELVFLIRDNPQFTAEEETSHLLSNSVGVAERLLKACEKQQWNNADPAAVMS